MKTHEVEKLLGITKQALIYYEKENLINPSRDENNYRNYNEDDLRLLKLILMLRSLDLSIDEIKLILNNQLSIRACLLNKQQYLQKSKNDIEEIEQRINEYIKRIKVKLILNGHVANEDNRYVELFIDNQGWKFSKQELSWEQIQSIDISICLSKGEDGRYYAVYNLYFICLDINTVNDTYSLEIMNDSITGEFFTFIKKYDLKINDPMNLIEIYQRYPDSLSRYKYINRNFHTWNKQYNLDVAKDNHFTVIKENIEILKKIKEQGSSQSNFKQLIVKMKDILSRLNKK